MKLQTCFSLTLFFITRQRRFIFCQGSRSSWGGREHSSLSSPLLVFSYCYSWFEGNVTSCILYMLTWMNLSQFKVLSDCLLQTVGTEKMSPALTLLPTLVNFYLLEKIDTKIIATTQNHNKYYRKKRAAYARKYLYAHSNKFQIMDPIHRPVNMYLFMGITPFTGTSAEQSYLKQVTTSPWL